MISTLIIIARTHDLSDVSRENWIVNGENTMWWGEEIEAAVTVLKGARKDDLCLASITSDPWEQNLIRVKP